MPSAAATWRRAKKKSGTAVQKAGFRTVLFAALLTLAVTYSMIAARSGGDSPFRSPGTELGHRNLAETALVKVDECVDVIGSGIDDSAPVVAFIIWVVIMLWVFLGIAVVCDDHFEGALMTICEQLELSTAVGGATFMAAGSSAPELATSLVAVFTTRDATGLGTILGSAVFNLVAIICLSGIYGAGPYYKLTNGNDQEGAGEKAQALNFTKELKKINDAQPGKEVSTAGLFLDKRPLARDALFYVIALAMCVFFALTSVGDGWCDGVKATGNVTADHLACQFNNKPGFVWWEGLILSLFYGIYIHSMIRDEDLMAWMEEKSPAPVHIRLYLDEIEKKEKADDEDENGDGEDMEAGGLSALPSSAGSKPTGGATADEVGGLLADPTDEPAPKLEQTAAAVSVEEVEVAQEDLENVKAYSTKKLEERIEQLENRLEWIAEHGWEAKGKWEYKAVEEEEEDGNPFIDFAQKPWELAFAASIPACERDDFQNWGDEPEGEKGTEDYSVGDAIKFSEIPELYKAQIRKKAIREGDDDPEDDDLYLKGKHKRARVELWYAQSKRYMISFTMCIVWIGITSWAMVALAQKMGCHLGVGSFSMGLVVLAAGTSIPDALSSIVVAKEGDGDMACANAVGSNVFNIFLGIGLPMMFSEWTWGDPFVVPDGLPVLVSTLMLIMITGVMYLGLWSRGFVLTPGLSKGLLTMFPLYLGLCILFDADILPLYSGLCSNTIGHPLACKGLNDVVLF